MAWFSSSKKDKADDPFEVRRRQLEKKLEHLAARQAAIEAEMTDPEPDDHSEGEAEMAVWRINEEDFTYSDAPRPPERIRQRQRDELARARLQRQRRDFYSFVFIFLVLLGVLSALLYVYV